MSRHLITNAIFQHFETRRTKNIEFTGDCCFSLTIYVMSVKFLITLKRITVTTFSSLCKMKVRSALMDFSPCAVVRGRLRHFWESEVIA